MLFSAVNAFAQNNYVKLPQAKTNSPTLIFNKTIIGSEHLLKILDLSKEDVHDVLVLKDKPYEKTSDYYNLSSQGVLFVNLKIELASKTQSEMNTFFGLDEQNEIYIDGFLLDTKKYSIAVAGITEVEIVEPNNINKLKERVLNIWTLPKTKRYSKRNLK